MLMWEHQGRCPCGRRSYLFGQCSKCLQEERDAKAAAPAESPHEQPKEEEPVALDLTCSRASLVLHRPPAPSIATQAAPSLRLPDVLQTPEIKPGLQTRHVEFITASTIKIVVRDGGGKRKGYECVQEWAHNQELQLANKTKEEYPFRIAFVVELSDDVVPLQQCTDVRFEKAH